MSVLSIETLDDLLRERLEQDAARHGRPVDEHVRLLLLQALDADRPSEAGAPVAAGDTEVEYIELTVDSAPNREPSLREHTRVQYDHILARFSSDASTKRFGLFTRYFPCDIVDICVRGARIRCRRPLREQESIHLHFQPPGGEQLSIAARVVRVITDADGRLEYGVQYTEVMPHGELRALICSKVLESKFHD